MEDDKIYIFTFEHVNKKTGKKEILVSHGVGNNSLKNYCLPQETLDKFNLKNDENGYYI